MSLESVKAFYNRLMSDRTFLQQVQSWNPVEAYRQVMQTTEYDFTQAELENYTAHLLETYPSHPQFQDLEERELEAIVGGAMSLLSNPTGMLVDQMQYTADSSVPVNSADAQINPIEQALQLIPPIGFLPSISIDLAFPPIISSPIEPPTVQPMYGVIVP